MATITVEVDVDLDEIDTEDLIDEIIERFEKKSLSVLLSQKKRAQIIAELQSCLDAICPNKSEEIKIESLDDRMKYEHLVKVFHKYSLSDIQRLLPD